MLVGKLAGGIFLSNFIKNDFYAILFVMQTIKNFFQKWARRKRFYVFIVLVAVILFLIFKPKVDTTTSVDTVKLQNLESTVLASGEITSNTDLALRFNTSGVIKSMRVKVGDKVTSGQILATLDGGTAYGSLTRAEGALKVAQAKYQKLLAGNSNEEINLAEVALQNAEIDLENTKNQQNLLVENARKNLLNGDLEAVVQNNVSDTTAPTISGTYSGVNEGSYTITTYDTGAGKYFSVSGLSTGGGPVNTSYGVPLGTDGLYITFPTNLSSSSNNLWKVNIPNKESSSYLANLNAYNSALDTRSKTIASAEALVNSKKAELLLKKAKARTFEIDLAEAEVLGAQGDVQSAQAVYENTILRAPAEGTIIKVNYKLGEVAEVAKEAVVLQDIESLYLEANINEANIVKIVLGQEVTFTVDSFGPNVPFTGKVIHIDPGATVNNGIVNYKIKIAIDDEALASGIKPGMNADLKILINKKDNVLVVPILALVEREDGMYLRIVTNVKNKAYEERKVEVGMKGDGNLIEILSGANAGESFILVNK